MSYDIEYNECNMKFRHLLCADCKAEMRKAEAKYKAIRRLKIKQRSKQQSGKIKIKK